MSDPMTAPRLAALDEATDVARLLHELYVSDVGERAYYSEMEL